MGAIIKYINDMLANKSVREKMLFTLALLAVYRILVFIPVPFVDVQVLIGRTMQSGGGLEYFAMLLGGTLENFSLIAVGLIPYINASIILQLLTAVIPHLEELQEQGEQGTQKIQQYTRWLTFPLAFLQSIGMVYFINYLLGGGVIATDITTLLLTAFSLAVGSILLVWIGEMITEKGITNGISILIYASIVAGITSQVSVYLGSSGNDLLGAVIFMIAIVLVLMVLSILLIKTRKEIPIVYARQGNVQETASLPIPLNPVGMIPIIFSVAFVTFPYLLSQIIVNTGSQNATMQAAARWIEINFNIYTQQPSWIAILAYFILIIVFTFFYAMITFNPERIADNVQKRGGFVPGIRPGEETAKYLNGVLMHLCFWGGIGLGIIGVYSYILSYIPFIQQAAQSIGSIPVVVSGAGVIIIVGVVQELMNKINAEMLMERYDRI
ncbi:MAG: preprotein translocase subunit SecY [Candidatus Peribacteria bacterium]|nr:MAG: preprotein translocase subunit SecY [Candidatus Peribacteria bacterium]